MADSRSTPRRVPAKASVTRNLLRLISVVFMLLPEYWALRRFDGDAVNDGAPTRFATRLVKVYAINTTTGAVTSILVGKEPHGLTVWLQPGRYSLGHTGNLR